MALKIDNDGRERYILNIPKGLVTNYGEGGGGYKTGGGGVQVKFYLYTKWGGKSFSHAEGGAKKC